MLSSQPTYYNQYTILPLHSLFLTCYPFPFVDALTQVENRSFRSFLSLPERTDILIVTGIISANADMSYN